VALIQRRGYGEGTMDRLVGKDSIVSAVTGDKAQQTSMRFSPRPPYLRITCRKQHAQQGPGQAGNE